MAARGPSLTDDLKHMSAPSSVKENIEQMTSILQSKQSEISNNRNAALNKLKRLVVAKNNDVVDHFQVAIDQLTQLNPLVMSLAEKDSAVLQLKKNIQTKQKTIEDVVDNLKLSDPKLKGVDRIESEIRLINNRLSELAKKEKENKNAGNIAQGEQYQDMPEYIKLVKNNKQVLENIENIDAYFSDRQRLIDNITRLKNEMAYFEKAGNAGEVVDKMKGVIAKNESELAQKYSPQKVKAKLEERENFQAMLEANKDIMKKLQRDFHEMSPGAKEQSELKGKLEVLADALRMSRTLQQDETTLKKVESQRSELGAQITGQLETIVSKTKNEEIHSFLSEGLNRIKPSPPKGGLSMGG